MSPSPCLSVSLFFSVSPSGSLGLARPSVCVCVHCQLLYLSRKIGSPQSISLANSLSLIYHHLLFHSLRGKQQPCVASKCGAEDSFLGFGCCFPLSHFPPSLEVDKLSDNGFKTWIHSSRISSNLLWESVRVIIAQFRLVSVLGVDFIQLRVSG